jgi:hypothetical protein
MLRDRFYAPANAAARRWYARDRGASVLREVIAVLEEAAVCVPC